MFTGIIEGTGKVKKIEKSADGVRLEVEVHFKLDDLNVGDSIAINGVCLTVTSRLGHTFWADLATETLRITNLGLLQPDSAVNVERPLRVGSRVGGHFVQGHVDGVAKVLEIKDLSNTKEITFELPRNLSKYIVDKGSVTVDGVSLTVARSTKIYNLLNFNEILRIRRRGPLIKARKIKWEWVVLNPIIGSTCNRYHRKPVGPWAPWRLCPSPLQARTSSQCPRNTSPDSWHSCHLHRDLL